jgi:ribonuclease G
MNKEILINVEPEEKRVAILENKSLEEFYIERKDDLQLVGNIYKGKLTSLARGIRAAFVDIGLEKNGFLYTADIAPLPPKIPFRDTLDFLETDYDELRDFSEEFGFGRTELKEGQEIMVQVIKEPLGGKGVRLTTHITLPGRYLVLMPNDKTIGISKRIEDARERSRLKSILASLKLPKDMGFIIRTAARGCKERELVRDIKYLLNLWRRIKIYAQRKHSPSLIHEELSLVFRVIRDSFTREVARLIVDDRHEYRRIAQFLKSFIPNLMPRLQLYQKDVPLFRVKGIEREIELIYERRVNLPCKGYIVIEQTEGLVAIDVNTGRFRGGRSLEETAFLVNQEAAREIARQIKLRDIGGIIVIDFIDMEEPSHRQRIFEILDLYLKKDKARRTILPISEIGLVEMTRQRMRKSLESASYQPCYYCRGKGLVKSAATMSISVLREIKRYLTNARPRGSTRNRREVFITVHPQVASNLIESKDKSLSYLETKFKVKIRVNPDSNLHIEEIKIS